MCTWLWINTILVGGFNPSEKYDFVSWEYEIPNMEKSSIHVPNHQPECIYTWR